MGSARAVFEASSSRLQEITVTVEGRSGQISYRPLLTSSNLEGIESAKTMVKLEDYEELLQKGISFTTIHQTNYPKRLIDIPDPPYGILYKGELPKDEEKAIAIVGARLCSEYGKYMAKEFATYLAKRNIQIISGMAKGIDGISQHYAIENNGYSCGVLGCSVDICYPSEHRNLYETLQQKGCLLSEFPLKTPPKAPLFPLRNRIISGLSDAVLVIEAKEKSGTLITVDQALEQGRDVYAVPGKLVDALSYGCNNLIKQGATIVLSPKDLYEELRNGLSSIPCKEMVYPSYIVRTRSPVEERILELLDSAPLAMEIIYQQMEHIELHDLQLQLMELVLRGDLEQIAGNYFQKKYD